MNKKQLLEEIAYAESVLTSSWIKINRATMGEILAKIQKKRKNLFDLCYAENDIDTIIQESVSFVIFIVQKLMRTKKVNGYHENPNYLTADLILSTWSRILKLVEDENKRVKEIDFDGIVLKQSEKSLNGLKQMLVQSNDILNNKKLKIVNHCLNVISEENVNIK